uniref:hypothetical protein n=1 Tax=Iodobacter sp. CM08 TaxID=3085902 RepID=UPI0029810F2B|nr:hypothetical protein [Iodobacter sp. CM08]
MTYFMGTKSTFLAKSVSNDSSQARFYQVTVEETDPPYAGARLKKVEKGALMYGPKQLLLRPNESKWLKLYYQGPADNQPRFYRVTFHERPGYVKAYQGAGFSGSASLSTILVVQPRQAQQAYVIENNVLKNTGNTAYLAYVEGVCTDTSKTEPCIAERYLAPGGEMRVGSVSLSGAKLFLSNELTVEQMLQ